MTARSPERSPRSSSSISPSSQEPRHCWAVAYKRRGLPNDDQGSQHLYRDASNGDADITGTSKILELREYRNQVQHAGNVPAPENVDRYIVYASDFLDAATTGFLAVSLNSLSRASLVLDDEIRDAIVLAEASMDAGDVSAFGERAALALELIVYAFRERQPWRRRGQLDQYRLRQAVTALEAKKISSSTKNRLRDALAAIPGRRPLSSHDASRLADDLLAPGLGSTKPLLDVLQGLVTEVQFVSDQIETTTLVGDPAELSWFQTRVGRVTRFVQGSYHYLAADPPLIAEEMGHALTFVLDTALRQQRLALSPAPEWSSAGQAERRRWESLKAQIVELARQNEHQQVTIDDIVLAMGEPSPDEIEPALSELVNEDRLTQLAPELFQLGDEEA